MGSLVLGSYQAWRNKALNIPGMGFLGVGKYQAFEALGLEDTRYVRPWVWKIPCKIPGIGCPDHLRYRTGNVLGMTDTWHGRL